MTLEPGRLYRAKTAFGTQITFTVIETVQGPWTKVDLEESGAVEPNVWLNTALLLWISSEQRRSDAVQKAADEVIEALEVSAKTF
jgi:hypothetical protein